MVQPLDVFVEPVDAALRGTEITLLIRDEGPREQRTKAQLTFLVEDWGISKFRAKLKEKGKRGLAAGSSSLSEMRGFPARWTTWARIHRER